jgi:CHAT domain-containing protein
VLGKEHPSTLTSLQNYFFWRAAAGAAGLKSQWSGDSGAVRLLRELLAAFDGYVAGGVDPARLADPTSLESRAAQLVSSFERARLAGVDGSDAPGLREPVFSIIQRFNASAAAKALAASAERLAVTDDARQALVEERADAQTRLANEVRTLDVLQQQPQRNPDLEAAARARIAPIERRIAEIDAALVENDAGAAEVLGAARATTGELTAVTKDRAQALLGADEALIVYSSVGGRYFAVVKTRRLSTTVSLDVDRAEIDRRVTALRSGLALPASGNARDLATFDLDAAEALHKILIDPLKPHLRDIRKLIIVADGPLQSLPFGVLAEAAGKASLSEMERYKASTFLIDRYAVSVQPSVSAISTLRAETPRSAGSKPLLGFADPVLRPRTAGAGDAIRVGKADEKKDVIIPMSGTVDAESLEDLLPLKQTKELLEAVGASLGANARDLYIGEDAQEADIRFLNEQGRLKNYRMIVFATHGLVSNEIEAIDLIEPALVMSLPPVAAGKERPWENDGLLRASDIVGFDMDADLVILAACNTAAADGTPGAEPLSGLAKAFMARGARALLVSHWQAEAHSSAVLIPAMARYAEQDGFAVGLAKAQRELRANAAYDPDELSNTLHYAHPAIWGAFTLIGDPGR